MNECDFCRSESEYLIAVNDGLWAICSPCNDYVHIQMDITNKRREVETQPSESLNIYGKKLCRGMSCRCTPDNCMCGEEE